MSFCTGRMSTMIIPWCELWNCSNGNICLGCAKTPKVSIWSFRGKDGETHTNKHKTEKMLLNQNPCFTCKFILVYEKPKSRRKDICPKSGLNTEPETEPTIRISLVYPKARSCKGDAPHMHSTTSGNTSVKYEAILAISRFSRKTCLMVTTNLHVLLGQPLYDNRFTYY